MLDETRRHAWLVRRVLVLATAFILAIFVVKVSIARVVDTDNPSFALTMNSKDARAMAALAETLATPAASRTMLARADDLARSSLTRDGTISPAIRTLGLVADLRGDRKRATDLFEFAALTSSRDLPTQLWLIQYAVDRDDAAGALKHFDIALRSSHRSATMLFPVLVNAIEDDRLLSPISDLLARGPWWGNGYLVNLVVNGKATGNIVALFERLQIKRVAVSSEAKTLLVNRLVRENRFIEASSIYKAMISNARSGFLQNGDFEKDFVPPFDWVLTDTPTLRGERIIGKNGTIALGFHAAAGTRGIVARQLVVLAPGEYQIRGVATLGNQSGNSRVAFNVECANASVSGSSGINLLVIGGDVGPAQTLLVPATNCKAVWVNVLVEANDGAVGTDGEIDNIDLFATVK